MNGYIRVKAYREKTKVNLFTFTPNHIKKTHVLKGLSINNYVYK